MTIPTEHTLLGNLFAVSKSMAIKKNLKRQTLHGTEFMELLTFLFYIHSKPVQCQATLNNHSNTTHKKSIPIYSRRLLLESAAEPRYAFDVRHKEEAYGEQYGDKDNVVVPMAAEGMDVG
jgi:hypothetical protein